MAVEGVSFEEPDFELSVHGCGEEHVVLEVCESGDSVLVAVGEVVEFEGLQVVDADVFVQGFVVLFGEVDVLVLGGAVGTFIPRNVPTYSPAYLHHSILTLWS